MVMVRVDEDEPEIGSADIQKERQGGGQPGDLIVGLAIAKQDQVGRIGILARQLFVGEDADWSTAARAWLRRACSSSMVGAPTVP